MNSSQAVRFALRHHKFKPPCWWPPGVSSWQKVPGRMVVASLLVCAVCSGSASAKPPLWWWDPKTEDCENLYFVASAEACPTEQEAREAAFLNARKEIASHLGLDSEGGFLKTSLAGVDETAHPTEHGPMGWACWIMVSYPKTLYTNLIERLKTKTLAGHRHKVLVAPFAFDQTSQKDYPGVIDKYRKKCYGWGLWQTIEAALDKSPDFEADTRPSNVTDEITAAAEKGVLVTEDVPEYLLIPNAHFFEYTDEQLKGWSVISNLHYHVSVHLTLYHLENGHWRHAASAMEDKVDQDELGATNTGARQAVQELLECWRAKQPIEPLDQK